MGLAPMSMLVMILEDEGDENNTWGDAKASGAYVTSLFLCYVCYIV